LAVMKPHIVETNKIPKSEYILRKERPSTNDNHNQYPFLAKKSWALAN